MIGGPTRALLPGPASDLTIIGVTRPGNHGGPSAVLEKESCALTVLGGGSHHSFPQFLMVQSVGATSADVEPAQRKMPIPVFR